MYIEASVNIQAVRGGFVISYPTEGGAESGAAGVQYVSEVATSIGKAMRIAKAAVEKYSLVTKSKEDEADAA